MLTEKDYCDYETRLGLRDVCYPMRTVRMNDGHIQMPRITLYKAQKWLRENKQIDISITLYMEGYAATIKHFYVFEGEFAWKEPIILQCCKFHEEALLKGIKEAIKILKEK